MVQDQDGESSSGFELTRADLDSGDPDSGDQDLVDLDSGDLAADERRARAAELADQAAMEWQGARLRPSAFDKERLEARRQQRREIASLADLSTIGLVFPAALAFGYFAGRFIGGWLGAAETGGMVGGLVGIVGGFYNVYKVAVRLQKSDAQDSADLAPSDDGERPRREEAES